jgi:hypothetical protein
MILEEPVVDGNSTRNGAVFIAYTSIPFNAKGTVPAYKLDQAFGGDPGSIR